MTRDFEDREFLAEEEAHIDDRHEDVDPNRPTPEEEHEAGEQGGEGAEGGEPGGPYEGRERQGGRRRGRGRDDRGERGGDDRRPRVDSFEKMKVWQEAHQLTLKVFAVTPKLPAEQQAGLALQMEQAAVSVPKSIAEGFKRRGPRNKAHFYNVAQTNLEALRYYFILCRDLGYDVSYDDLSYRGDQIARMLDGLIRSMMR
jgi:four helix bundle protein